MSGKPLVLVLQPRQGRHWKVAPGATRGLGCRRQNPGWGRKNAWSEGRGRLFWPPAEVRNTGRIFFPRLHPGLLSSVILPGLP